MKEPTKAGVYRIHSAEKGMSYIGYTYNLQGLFKRFRFELGLNSCSVKPLQAMYRESGGKVDMQILEELPCRAGDDSSEDTLTAALDKWQSTLESQGEQVRIILL